MMMIARKYHVAVKKSKAHLFVLLILVFSWIIYYSVNSVWHIVKFRSSLRQITVNFTVDGQLKENQLRISSVLIIITSHSGARTARRV